MIVELPKYRHTFLRRLCPDFRPLVEQLIDICYEKGIIIALYCGIRDPWIQARMWRQSRTKSEIETTIEMLKNEGAYWIAKILHDVGTQHGRKITDALPGTSWHQYGAAIDCFIEKEGEAIWDDSEIGYTVYREEAIKLGLSPGPKWDINHVQLYSHSVLDKTSWQMVDSMMKRKWGAEGGLQ